MVFIPKLYYGVKIEINWNFNKLYRYTCETVKLFFISNFNMLQNLFQMKNTHETHCCPKYPVINELGVEIIEKLDKKRSTL